MSKKFEAKRSYGIEASIETDGNLLIVMDDEDRVILSFQQALDLAEWIKDRAQEGWEQTE